MHRIKYIVTSFAKVISFELAVYYYSFIVFDIACYFYAILWEYLLTMITKGFLGSNDS